jgi:hypothetical protein
MEDTTAKPAVEWHEMKGTHVAMRGDQVICIIEPVEGLPFKAWGVQPMAAVFSTVDSAKAEAEAGHQRFLKNSGPQPNFYVDILEQLLTALKAKAEPK